MCGGAIGLSDFSTSQCPGACGYVPGVTCGDSQTLFPRGRSPPALAPLHMLNKVTPSRQQGAASHVSSTSMGSEKQPRASHESHLNQLSAHENSHANLLLPTSLVVLMACAKNWGTPDSIANTQTSQSQTAANWWHTHHRHPSSALCRD